MSTTGTYTIGDLLIIGNVNISEFGEDTVAEVLNRDIRLFNSRVVDMMSQLASPITELKDRLARYGTSIDGDMIELDEFGQPPAQKETVGVNVGFPLRKYGFAVGWTRDYMLNRTPADAAIATTNAQKAYLRALHKELRRAVFYSTNFDFIDKFTDKLSLPVKRFVNADGAAIPEGPNGETFDGSTHTHYLGATAAWSGASDAQRTADVTALIDTVVEHGHVQGVRVYINKAQEVNVRALTGFSAYVDPRIVYRASDTPGRTLDLTNSGNRAIGIFEEAEVWVKPWIPANYIFCFATGSERPLKFRQHHIAGVRGLRVAFEMDDYPLRAELMETYFGFGTWTRTNGACLRTNDTSWADPTITS